MRGDEGDRAVRSVGGGPGTGEGTGAETLAEARRLRNAGEIDRAVRRYGDALDTAARRGRTDLQVEAFTGLARCALDRGDLDRALTAYGRAERLAAGRPPSVRARAVHGRALTHLMGGDTRYCCHLLEKAIDELLAAREDDPDALVLLRAALISPYVDLGEHERAARCAESALALEPRTTDPETAAYLHRQRGRSLVDEGRFAEADEALDRAEDGYRRLGIRIEVAQCHWARGYVRLQQGRLEESEREFTHARDALLGVGSELIAMQVEVELADVLRRRGRPGEAAERLGRMLRGLRGDRGAVHAAAAHHLLGGILAEGDDTGGAERHYRAALVLRHQSGLAGDLAETCRQLGDLLHASGRTGEAVEVYRFGLGGLSRPGATTLGPGQPVESGEPPSAETDSETA